MKKLIFPIAVLSLFALICNSMAAQSKAQIHIKKNQNGVISEETREIPLEDGQQIQDILMEMGVLDQLGQLKEGQELEIRIDKSDGLNDLENFSLILPPDAPEFTLPDFAIAPPIENRPFLGVMLKQNTNKENGIVTSSEVIITEIVAGTAAEKAGLKAGDEILEIDNKKVEGINDFIEQVQTHEIGDKVELTINRSGKKKKIKAELGEKAMESNYSENDFPQEKNMFFPKYDFRFGPDSITIFCPPSSPNCNLPNDSMKICQPFSWNGSGLAVKESAFLGVTPTDQEGIENGVKINVEEETAAEKMGLMDGDIIKKINGKAVNNFDELADQVSQMKPGETISLNIDRDGREKEIKGEVGKRSVSGFDNFRIFHDFKGMDEGGNYFYDYEFDMDEKDIEQRMQELLNELDEQQMQLDDERNRIESELDRYRESREVMVIKISIAEISKEEAAVVNQKASPKLQVENTLPIEQISFFPNPGNGILNLNFVTTEKSPVKVILYNGSGEVVYLEERSSFDGNYNKTIDISDEPNGTYYLQIIQNNKTYSKKVVKGM